MRRAAICVTLAGLFFSLILRAAYAADGGDYLFEPADQLRLKVVEWQASDSSFRDLTALDGLYDVSAAGTISVPFLGSMQVEGKDAQSVGDAISQGLTQKLGLASTISASVEIAQYRPIYVAGVVTKAGQYPFEPGLNVLKAVALGGGLFNQDTDFTASSDFLTAKGQYDQALVQQAHLIAAKARLEAERSGNQSLATPPEISGNPNAVSIMATESDALRIDSSLYVSDLSSLDAQKSLLNSEIVSLGKKADAQVLQQSLLQQELKSITGLAAQGLAVNSQVLDLRQQLADVQSRMLDTDLAALNAKKDLASAGVQQQVITNKHDLAIDQSLSDTNQQLADLQAQINTARQKMLDATIRSARSIAYSDEHILPTVVYSISRQSDDGQQEFTAADSTPVLPGDVVKVSIASGSAL